MSDSRPSSACERRRAQCARCLRPASACICGWIRPTHNDVEVLILQHPLEVTQAKGSARLLQLSLSHCEVLMGETLDADVLHASLLRPMADGRPAHAVLLYPDTPAAHPPSPGRSSTGHAAAVMPDAPSDTPAAATRLDLIDGTWRKSLKMLHANPLLQTLPRISLTPDTPSRYQAMRKAPRPGQLSTLEAACLALSELETRPDRYEALLTAFDDFVLANLSSSERHTTRLRPPRLAS